MSERIEWIKESTAVYKVIWNELGFITDEQAKARACNMVMMDKRIQKSFSDDVSAYSAIKQEWNYCPWCNKMNINHKSKKDVPYQGCFDCRILLQKDGTIKQMLDRGPTDERA